MVPVEPVKVQVICALMQGHIGSTQGLSSDLVCLALEASSVTAKLEASTRDDATRPCSIKRIPLRHEDGWPPCKVRRMEQKSCVETIDREYPHLSVLDIA